MENSHQDITGKENSERKVSNTEYAPTKCRITKPPPPKPAANPLQFIKVTPSSLFQKAHEQIKKTEELKVIRQEIKDEPADWQQNLDNWKSCRRKRQEHIIERVVEVKKLEQEEHERIRRKSKTFNEMMEERNKRGQRLNIPIYDDDSNDLSDYGIGSSSSKTNSIKDVDTDDSGSILDERENCAFDLTKDTSSASNHSQSEDEVNPTRINGSENKFIAQSLETNTNKQIKSQILAKSPPKFNHLKNKPALLNKPVTLRKPTGNSVLESKLHVSNLETKTDPQQYTYEGAIQDYRSRIKSKINDSIFNKTENPLKSKEYTEAQTLVPKGNIGKCKEIFEIEKPVEIHHFESNTSRRLSEDFANTQSIRERLKSLEKCTDQSLKSIDKNDSQLLSIKERIKDCKQQNEMDSKNNNNMTDHDNAKLIEHKNDNNNMSKPQSNYFFNKSNSNSSINNEPNNDRRSKEQIVDRSSSPEAELFINTLNMFSRDLDTILGKSTSSLKNDLDEYCNKPNYPASTSSLELIGVSSDREDSGIHTADVSCSVSQADEPIEDTNLYSNAIPNSIEKLKQENEMEFTKQSEIPQEQPKCVKQMEEMPNTLPTKVEKLPENKVTAELLLGTIRNTIKNSCSVIPLDNMDHQIVSDKNVNRVGNNNTNLVVATREFLSTIQQDAHARFSFEKEHQKSLPVKSLKTTDTISINNISPSNNKSPFIAKNVMSENSEPTKELKLNINKETKPIIYENVIISSNTVSENSVYPIDCVCDGFFTNSFPLGPLKAMEPPNEKPPPPPSTDDEDTINIRNEPVIKRLNSAKRIKKEIHIKRSSFLGLDEPTDDQLDPEITVDRPPDINSFLQKECQFEKSLYQKFHGSREGGLSEVESQDSGLESERGRLSSDTWCSSVADSSMPVHGRQDSEQTNSITSEEDEIMKKEREIIEMVEKEEKSRDNDCSIHNGPKSTASEVSIAPCDISRNNFSSMSVQKETHDVNFYHQPHEAHKSNLDLNDKDSEVLKVEHELLQLEREELKRQKENLLFQESRSKLHQKNNRHSLENICDSVDVYPQYLDFNYRKSMPELQQDLCSPKEYCKPLPEVPNIYYSRLPDIQYRKSMPDIHQANQKSILDGKKNGSEVQSEIRVPLEHRKSMPELQHELRMSAFQSPPHIKRQPIMPGKPIRPLMKEQRDERYLMFNPQESDALRYQNSKCGRALGRPGLHALSAVPKPRHIPNDNWIQPKANPETKSYSQHWLFQEAEHRRIVDQQKNISWQQPRQEKHIPEPIIQTLTQRVQSRTSPPNKAQLSRRSDNSPNKEFSQRSYIGHPHTLGHASRMSYPPNALEDTPSQMLSVSGKKKCSFCGNELGRGAAMIIESLCLFYHMECFKCCVCHMQLGDGLMGTDVRVRNQKLHCHNCYSSDDGVKFSCV